MDRRKFISSVGLAVPAVLSTDLNSVLAQSAPAAQPPGTQLAPAAQTGRLKQGITTQALLGGESRSIEDRCKLAASLGMKSFDFASDPSWWPVMKKYGIVGSCYRLIAPPTPATAAVASPATTPAAPNGRPRTPPGWEAIGHKEAMGDYLKAVHTGIDVAAENGFPNVIVLAGSATPDVDYRQGADNTVTFLNEVKSHAEQKGVTLVLEKINSKGIFGGRTTFFDKMPWGLDVFSRVNSSRVKMLFDCFHAQLMEGDVVQTIRDHIDLIGHFHVAGVPGHHCPDDTQELNYHFVARAIADLNYQGYICHEWNPVEGSDPVSELKKAIQVLTV